jgi:hypothetical protein
MAKRAKLRTVAPTGAGTYDQALAELQRMAASKQP